MLSRFVQSIARLLCTVFRTLRAIPVSVWSPTVPFALSLTLWSVW